MASLDILSQGYEPVNHNGVDLRQRQVNSILNSDKRLIWYRLNTSKTQRHEHNP